MIGAVLGAARAHRHSGRRQLTAVYVEVIRNMPILVQIFMIFFALPQFGILRTSSTVAWLSVMIWGGAFSFENFRAGFRPCPIATARRATRYGFGLARPRTDAADRGADRAPSSINTYISVVKKHLR